MACGLGAPAGAILRSPRGWDVENLLGDAEHPFDRWVPTTADQHQPEAANIDGQCLFGDIARPEQHAGQWREHYRASESFALPVPRADHVSARVPRERVGTPQGHAR